MNWKGDKKEAINEILRQPGQLQLNQLPELPAVLPGAVALIGGVLAIAAVVRWELPLLIAAILAFLLAVAIQIRNAIWRIEKKLMPSLALFCLLTGCGSPAPAIAPPEQSAAPATATAVQPENSLPASPRILKRIIIEKGSPRWVLLTGGVLMSLVEIKTNVPCYENSAFLGLPFEEREQAAREIVEYHKGATVLLYVRHARNPDVRQDRDHLEKVAEFTPSGVKYEVILDSFERIKDRERLPKSKLKTEDSAD